VPFYSINPYGDTVDMQTNSKALIVLSGGQDSTTCLYWAKKRYKIIETITFDYGQRHQIEIDCARKIAAIAQVSNTVIPINSFTPLGGNSLISDQIPVNNDLQKNGLPNTFVPGRNLIFLTIAAAFAYNKGILDLITGVCETDYSGYPDCRSDTMKALEASISLGMEADFKIITPLMHLSKAQSIKLAEEVGAFEALGFSHTCYNGVYPPCHKCPACTIRARGFEEAELVDPLINRANNEK